jgi:aminocarboxymuconate-semialdehyde decarboxylase
MSHCGCRSGWLGLRGGFGLGPHRGLGAVAPGGGSRGTKVQAIDVHAHYYPERFLKSLAEEGSPPNFQVDVSNPQAPAVMRGAVRQQLDASYWDLERRVKRMDGQRVDTHALSLTLPMVHWTTPERGARLARIVNDAMIEAHTAYPERFYGCAALPLQEPALALQELNRVAGQKALRAVYLPTNVNGKELADPVYWPIYERCEALDWPVMLHPTTVIGAERLQQRYYLNNLLGNPFDTTVAAAHLIFGGVLDRFPRLNVVLPHAGGALPFLWGRLQHGQAIRPETKDLGRKPVREYLRRFHYDIISHAPELLGMLIQQVGADRVMLGSDYCFDMGYEQPRDVVMGLKLSRSDEAAILGGNAARLLRL